MADAELTKVIDIDYLERNLDYFTKKLGPDNWLTQHAQKALDLYRAGNTNTVPNTDARVTYEELDDLVSQGTDVTGWIGVFAPTSGPREAEARKALAQADEFIEKIKKLRDRVHGGDHAPGA